MRDRLRRQTSYYRDVSSATVHWGGCPLSCPRTPGDLEAFLVVTPGRGGGLLVTPYNTQGNFVPCLPTSDLRI